jgi:hypothetical protein
MERYVYSCRPRSRKKSVQGIVLCEGEHDLSLVDHLVAFGRLEITCDQVSYRDGFRHHATGTVELIDLIDGHLAGSLSECDLGKKDQKKSE